MPTVFIGVGSNLGDRDKNISIAKNLLLKTPDIRDLQCSPVYETEPVEAEGGKYWNAVWSFETGQGPLEVLEILSSLEQKAGRVRKRKNGPRPLDLDVLFFGEDIIQNETLTIPHPRIPERAFVLVPFCDLAPDWLHPVLGKTMKQLLEKLNGQYAENPSPHTVFRVKNS